MRPLVRGNRIVANRAGGNAPVARTTLSDTATFAGIAQHRRQTVTVRRCHDADLSIRSRRKDHRAIRNHREAFSHGAGDKRRGRILRMSCSRQDRNCQNGGAEPHGRWLSEKSGPGKPPCCYRPVDPNPPEPRCVSSSVATMLSSARVTGAITICAIRSPRLMTKASWPRLIRITFTSPR